ncbi:MAG: hypothetical protein ACLTMH_16620 [Faecalimonas umbilicata]|uniref:hypothetical protein n=1 Tax=Faecalimonas umbilicata TaxID=1912855 RepID=UPI00399623AA
MDILEEQFVIYLKRYSICKFSQNIFQSGEASKGEVHLLASTANRKQEIPYISMKNGETIKNSF